MPQEKLNKRKGKCCILQPYALDESEKHSSLQRTIWLLQKKLKIDFLGKVIADKMQEKGSDCVDSNIIQQLKRGKS